MGKARHTKRRPARHRRKTRRIRGGEGGLPRLARPLARPSLAGLSGLVSASPFKKSKLVIPPKGSKVSELLTRIQEDDESLNKIEEADIKIVNDIIHTSTTLPIYLSRMKPIYTKYGIVSNNSPTRNDRPGELRISHVNDPRLSRIAKNVQNAMNASYALRTNPPPKNASPEALLEYNNKIIALTKKSTKSAACAVKTKTLQEYEECLLDEED